VPRFYSATRRSFAPPFTARFNTDTGGFGKRLEELTAEKEAAVGPATQADDSSTSRTDTGSAIQAQAPAMV